MDRVMLLFILDAKLFNYQEVYKGKKQTRNRVVSHYSHTSNHSVYICLI